MTEYPERIEVTFCAECGGAVTGGGFCSYGCKYDAPPEPDILDQRPKVKRIYVPSEINPDGAEQGAWTALMKERDDLLVQLSEMRCNAKFCPLNLRPSLDPAATARIASREAREGS